jgi:hypothetical protein
MPLGCLYGRFEIGHRKSFSMKQVLLTQLESGWPEDQKVTIAPDDIARDDFLSRLKQDGYEFRWSHVQRVRALTQTGWEPASDHDPARPIIYVNASQMVLVARKVTDPIQKLKIQ